MSSVVDPEMFEEHRQSSLLLVESLYTRLKASDLTKMEKQHTTATLTRIFAALDDSQHLENMAFAQERLQALDSFIQELDNLIPA